MGRRVLAVSVVSLMVGVFALPGLASHQPPGGTFTDDDGSVHEGYIEALVEAGITTGCGTELFCPDDPVTRGQMAAFLNRALSFPPGAGDSFTDDDGSVFEGDIERLAASGVTRGCNPPDNTLFCPDDSVTRGQMAAFLVRAFEYEDGAGSDRFSDDDASVFEADIERLAAAGVTLGCNPPDNTLFCPDQDVTRAQMATFLGRALGLTPDTPPPRPTTTTIPTTTSTTTIATTTSTGVPTIFDVRVGVGLAVNVFSPDDLTIDEGDRVRFTNEGGFHNLVFDDGGPGMDSVSSGIWSVTRTFTNEGVYTYFCVVHLENGMDGQVVVSG
jgi:plastocyanin